MKYYLGPYFIEKMFNNVFTIIKFFALCVVVCDVYTVIKGNLHVYADQNVNHSISKISIWLGFKGLYSAFSFRNKTTLAFY